MKKTLSSLGLSCALILSSACATAQPVYVAASAPSGWALNPDKCPDLVEDRIDRREDRRDSKRVTGLGDLIEDKRDRAENRADEAVIRCPASAWEWTGPTYRKSVHIARPAPTTIYYNPVKRHYYRNVGPRRVVVRF